MTDNTALNIEFSLHYEEDSDGTYAVYSGPKDCKELWDHIGDIKCSASHSGRLDRKHKLVYTWSGNATPLLGWEIQQLAAKLNELNGERDDQ
jgi:hypothetical protein